MKLTLLTLLTCAAFGQHVASFDDRLGRISSAGTDAQRQAAIDLMLNESQNIATEIVIRSAPALAAEDQISAKIFEQNLTKIVKQYRSLRGDTQTGASSGSSGSTSLVLNPYLADIFGVSIESGAILKTVSGQTVNLQIKPAGLFCGTKDNDGSKAAPGAGCLEFWKRVGITAAFDKGRSNAPSQLVALQDDFSELRVHFDLLEPTVKQVHAAMMQRMNASSADATEIAAMFEDPRLQTWVMTTNAALTAAANTAAPTRRAAIDQAWDLALNQVKDLVLSQPDLHDKLATVLVRFARSNIDANLGAVHVDQLERTSFAAEYSWNRPDVAKADIAGGIVTKGQRPPDLSSAGLIYARNYQPLVLSANARVSWFNERLPGMKDQLRDWQISASATFLLKEIPNFGKTTLTFAGLIGQLHQQPLGFDYTVPLVNDPTQTQKIDLAGSFRAFNTRLEFPTANKSVTIPFSFTYANRTDLNKETDVRGSFGMTIRFDSFFPAK